MEKIKNISVFVFAIMVLGVISCIGLLPIDAILQEMSLSDFHSEYISLTLKMALIFIGSYWMIKQLNIKSISGLSNSYKWTFKYFNIIPIYLIVLGVLSAMAYDLTQIQMQDLLLLLLACMIVGFAEEFLFRGVLQSMFLKTYHNKKRGLLLSVLFPAIIFGLFHLINLTNNPNVMAVVMQVVFATFIGFFFGVLVLKTNKIIPVAITHGLINFSFSLLFLPGLNVEEPTGFSLAPIILTLPLFIIGLLVIKKVKTEDVVDKIKASFN